MQVFLALFITLILSSNLGALQCKEAISEGVVEAAFIQNRSSFSLHRHIYNEFILKNEILFPVDIKDFEAIMDRVSARSGYRLNFDYEIFENLQRNSPEVSQKIASIYFEEALRFQATKGQFPSEVQKLRDHYGEGGPMKRAVLEVVQTHFSYYFLNWSHFSRSTFTKAKDPLYIPLLAVSFLGFSHLTGDNFASLLLSSSTLSAYAMGKLSLGKVALRWRTHNLVRSVKKIFSHFKKELVAEVSWTEWSAESKSLESNTAEALRAQKQGDAVMAISYRILNNENIVEAIRVIDIERIKNLKKTSAFSRSLGRAAQEDQQLMIDIIDGRLEQVSADIDSTKLDLHALSALPSTQSQESLARALIPMQAAALGKVEMQIGLSRGLLQQLRIANQLALPN